MAVLEGAVLPKGSWILVTGANGYVASHVVNQFLQLGYHARGTVRDATKHAWLTEYFSNKYPDVQFQLVEVKDLTDVAALTKAAEGCAGFAAVASDVTFGSDIHKIVQPSIDLALAALAAAAATPTMKRFVQTSSSAAIMRTEVPPGTPYELPIDHFNQYAVDLAYRPLSSGAAAAEDPLHPLWVYSASKVLQERAVWAWRDDDRRKELARRGPGGEGEGRLSLGISTVLPDYVVGEVLSIAHQGYPSSAGLIKAIWDGDIAQAQMMPPQFAIDAQDAGRLHVAALLHPGLGADDDDGAGTGERIVAFADRKNLVNTVRYLRELYPDRTFPEPPADEKEMLANVQGKPRAEELLRWVKGSGFTGYKESLKELCDGFL